MADPIKASDIAQLSLAIAKARKARGDVAGANRMRHSAYVVRVAAQLGEQRPSVITDKDKQRHAAWVARVSKMVPPKAWEAK